MHALVLRLAPFATILKVVVLLGLVDWWVAGPFFTKHILREYRRSAGFFRQPSQHPGIMFDVLRRLSPPDVRIGAIGDSTMFGREILDTSSLPSLTWEALGQRFQDRRLELIDSSEIGLYAGDAALIVTKLFGCGTDVVVYGLTLRAFPRQPLTRYVTRLSDELSPSDLFRVASVGGGRWVANYLGPERVIRGSVRSHWATYAYRDVLRRFLWAQALEPAAAVWGPLPEILRPQAPQPLSVAPRWPVLRSYDWTRQQYGAPNLNWEALDLIGRLCARHAPGRCVLYAGPVNPFGRGRVAEPGLYEEYVTQLRAVADRYGLIWRDYSDVMTAADFAPPKFGGLRDPVHLNRQGRTKLAALLVDPLEEAIRRVGRAVAKRHEPLAIRHQREARLAGRP